MSYTKLVMKRKNFKYSANICFDIKDEDKLSCFIPNIAIVDIFREYFLGIVHGNSKSHSRILYGSYGTGKSHFLTVLSAVLGHINTDGIGLKNLVKAIEVYDKDLSKEIQRFVSKDKPYLVVPIYSHFKKFDQCIMYSLKKELERNNISISFKNYFEEALFLINKWKSGEESSKRLAQICKSEGINLKELCRGLESYEHFSGKEFETIFKLMTYGVEFINNAGNMFDNIELVNDTIKDQYKGIVFIFDEFGRYVEDMGEDIKVKMVQDLAEFCDHSQYDDYLILVSHKQLSLYIDKMKQTVGEEWKKIEGRFMATSINVKCDQVLSLISHIIPKKKFWNKFKIQFKCELDELYSQGAEFKGFLLSSEKDGTNLFEGAFPLHPIALFSLDRLAKKVSQNERTFFTYLASDEADSFFMQLGKMNENEFHFIGVDNIYDYFEESICAYRSDEVYATYKKLQAAINKLGNVTNGRLEVRLLKAMAVIYIIADTATFSADKQTLVNILDADKGEIENAFDNLEKLRIVKYMRQYGYYDFWDSSIYDLDSAIYERMKTVTDEIAISMLNEEFSDFVIYPYEYNLRYHMNRIFLPVFARKEDFVKKNFIKRMPKYYDGIVAFVFDEHYVCEEYFSHEIALERMVFMVSEHIQEILLELKRYVAIKYLYSLRNELAKEDSTVVKELELYLEEQKGIVDRFICDWKEVKKGVIVVSGGQEKKVTSSVELSEVMSEVMEDAFSQTIIVNNDLINKNNVSGAIKLARVKALNYIINDDDILKNCSLMSPEHTIIRSVLLKNGFYQDDTVLRKNVLPNGRVAGEPVSGVINCYLNKCVKGQVAFQELYEQLKKPPFGLRDGYLSVLLAYELRKYENVSLYFHGMEHDYCGEELLMALENPEDYSLYLCNWSKEELHYIEAIEDVFNDFINFHAPNRLKELYAAMNKHFVVISKAARTTDRFVSEVTKRYREIMSILYKDYNRFFFETLLEINDDYQQLVLRIKVIKAELDNVIQLQVDNLEGIIREILNVEPESKIVDAIKKIYEKDWKKKRYKFFSYQTSMILDYIQRLDENIDDEIFVKDIAKIITGFEIEYWDDSKIEEFQDIFYEMVKQLNDFIIQEKIGCDEVKISINTGESVTKVLQFNALNLSVNGQTMFNKMKRAIEDFGLSVSYEEKMNVVMKLLSEIM